MLVAPILSCIDLGLDTPQHLGLLCAIPRNTKEMVVALNDTLHTIIDTLVRVRSVVVSLWVLIEL